VERGRERHGERWEERESVCVCESERVRERKKRDIHSGGEERGRERHRE
jgi:hypothetical protein